MVYFVCKNEIFQMFMPIVYIKVLVLNNTQEVRVFRSHGMLTWWHLLFGV
jgi:hypothetical protein